MARDVFRSITTTELIGTIDKNINDDVVVIVEGGKDESPYEVEVLELIKGNLGKQIALKITEEAGI
jgi:hypothetical protein